MQPTKLTIPKDRKSLKITFGDDQDFEFTAEILRVLSPSAEVRGHSPDQRKTVGGKKNVEIMKVEPVGNYAVRITFDDMHDTGIFSWSYFKERIRRIREKSKCAMQKSASKFKGLHHEQRLHGKKIPSHANFAARSSATGAVS